MWKQSLTAAAASVYEFTPSFVAQAVAIERAGRSWRRSSAKIRHPRSPRVKIDEPVATPVPAPIVHQPPAPMPVPTMPLPPPPPPVLPSGPVTVAPNAVVKLSGTVPNVVRASKDLPPMAAAKLCIDTAGAVTSVEFLSGKLERRVIADLGDSLKTWKYQPYKKAGTPVGACFVVTLRLRN